MNDVFLQRNLPVRETEAKTSFPVPTPKILDDKNDFYMSEKIRYQDAATKASSTSSRSRRARWHGEAIQPEPARTKDCRHEFRNPFADTTVTLSMTSRKRQTYREIAVPTRERVRDGESLGLLSLRTSHHREDTSVMPAISAFGYSIQISEAATAKPVSRNEHDHSAFSFTPGDDSDPLLSEKGQGAPVSRYSEQAPSYLADGSLRGERRHHNTYNTSDSIARSMSGEGQRSSVGSDNDAVRCAPGGPHTVSRKPVRACCDYGHGRQTMMGSSPSQRSYSLESPAATFVPAKDTPQRQLAEMDARIAATLALANVSGSTNQKK